VASPVWSGEQKSHCVQDVTAPKDCASDPHVSHDLYLWPLLLCLYSSGVWLVLERAQLLSSDVPHLESSVNFNCDGFDGYLLENNSIRPWKSFPWSVPTRICWTDGDFDLLGLMMQHGLWYLLYALEKIFFKWKQTERANGKPPTLKSFPINHG
jgi:hypothetical protein